MYTEVILSSSDNNSSHFKAISYIDKYLYDNANNDTTHKRAPVVIANPFYAWIPEYVFHLNNHRYLDYLDNVLVKADHVLMMADRQWEYSS